MQSQRYHQALGATAACTVRLSEEMAQSELTCGLKGDSWFGSVKSCNELSLRGKVGVFVVKTSTSLYPKKFIEATLADCPGGCHIVLEGTHPSGQQLIAMGYRYSTKCTLCFIFNPGTGSTRPGAPYEMKYATDNGNVGVRWVDRPDVISKYFAGSNAVDKHNHVRQFELGLEKCWITHNPYFRLFTTLLGINVVDCWKLSSYHGLSRAIKVTNIQRVKMQYR